MLKMGNLLAATSATSTRVISFVILGIYILMMVLVAVCCRKKSKTMNDFFLAGRGLGGWMSAFAYGTTYFSSVVFIGYAGKFGWTMGLAAIWIGVGNALIGSYLAWKVLASRTRVMTHRLKASTMPEFFEKRYEAKGLRLFSAIIIFVFLIPYSASVYQGMGYLFEKVFGISFIWCILIMASLTALYLFFGGYFATALSDFIQGIIMIVGILIMFFVLMSRPEVNWGEGFKALTENGLGLIATAGDGKGWNSPMFNCIVLVLLTSFGIWGLPQSVHKFYTIKNRSAIRRATVVSTSFCGIIGVGAYFTGSVCSLFLDKVPNNNFDMIVPTMLEQVLPAALLGLIVVLVLSASMSTLASLSLSGSSAVAVDAYKGFLRPNATDKQVKLRMRLLCLLFIIVSMVLAIVKIEAIVTLMSLSWGTLAGCFIGPYVLGLYSKKINKVGAYASLISGLFVTLMLVIIFGCVSPANGALTFSNMIKGGVARSPLIGVIAMAASMLITPLASQIANKIKNDKCEAAAVLINETKTELAQMKADDEAAKLARRLAREEEKKAKS